MSAELVEKFFQTISRVIADAEKAAAEFANKHLTSIMSEEFLSILQNSLKRSLDEIKGELELLADKLIDNIMRVVRDNLKYELKAEILMELNKYLREMEERIIATQSDIMNKINKMSPVIEEVADADMDMNIGDTVVARLDF
jgi:hypothetical protein